MTDADTVAESKLAIASSGAARLADEAARKKEAKYREVAAAVHAVHLQFAVETMSRLSETAQQLLREIHHAASSGCTWRDADSIGSHLVDCIAVAVQRCNGKALQASVEMETRVALKAAA